MIIKSSFAKNFKFFRERSRLGQEALADKIGVNVRTISLYENGKGFPKVDLLMQISNVLNVPIEYFFVDNPETITQEKYEIPNRLSVFGDEDARIKISEYRGLVHAYRQLKESPDAEVFEKCIKSLEEVLDELESAYKMGRDVEGKLEYATQIIHSLTKGNRL